ncbi:hypothetical protein HYQ46_001672 [Verticillium longisporum]|nr:hypothetical protein HYQ46_001672 [Verticillium longisporum]
MTVTVSHPSLGLSPRISSPPPRNLPFHLPGQDVLTDMNLTPGGGDAPLRGIPKPWNILKFYDAGADDSPWVPPGIIVPDHRAGQGRHQNNPTALRDAFAPRYSEWRSPGPSECDTLPPGQLPSDSGYESRRTKQSIANASVFGDVDRGHETQSLTGRMDGFDPFEGMSSAPSYTGNSVNNHASMTEARGLSTLRTRGTAHSTVIICPDCGSHLKTKSELNKHKQRHSKPHKCDVSGCSRKEGFSGGDAPLRGIPKPWNILKFYDATADDSPWVPLGIIVPDHRAGQGQHQNSPTALRDAFAPRYSEWRSPGPSECDTLPPGQLPSDSGYESRRTKQSIANASVFGDVDRGHETQSLTGRMDGFDPFAGMSSTPSYTGNSANNHADMTETCGLSTLRTRGTAHSTVIICPDCGSHLKTKSELNKHKQRHSKPHKCDVFGCYRKEGFSIINDLDRHKRSVHRDTDTGGPRYRCHLAPCHNKKKIWPRADNFRSHLRRLHRVHAVDDDLAQYLIPCRKPYGRHGCVRFND